MSEYITITEKIERRTYFKGRFAGKFVGLLDAGNSDLRIENFYDIEINEAVATIKKEDFRVWQDSDGEFQEFSGVDKFTSKIPNPLSAKISDADGSIAHYHLKVFAPKLSNIKFFNRCCEKNTLYAAVEADISGYLRHFDTVEKQIEKPVPEIREIIYQPITSRTKIPVSNQNFTQNPGCAPLSGCAAVPGGCLSMVAIVASAYLFFAVGLMIISAVLNLFNAALGFYFVLVLFSYLLPLILIATLLYVFVKIQDLLLPFWKWIFRFIIAVLLFLFLFN